MCFGQEKRGYAMCSLSIVAERKQTLHRTDTISVVAEHTSSGRHNLLWSFCTGNAPHCTQRSEAYSTLLNSGTPQYSTVHHNSPPQQSSTGELHHWSTGVLRSNNTYCTVLYTHLQRAGPRHSPWACNHRRAAASSARRRTPGASPGARAAGRPGIAPPPEKKRTKKTRIIF